MLGSVCSAHALSSVNESCVVHRPSHQSLRPLSGLRRLSSCPNRARHGTPSGLAGRPWVPKELPSFPGNWYARAAPGLTRSQSLVCPCTELPNLCWSCLPWLLFSWRPASNLFLSGTDERLSKGQGLDIAVGSWGVPSVGQDLGFQQVKQAHSLLS